MSVEVRRFREEDLPRILAIAHECKAAQWKPEQYEKFFSRGAAGPRLLLVLTANHHVSGFIAAQSALDEWEIENIAVDPRKQCTGLGSHLLREFLKLARQNGSAVFLEVRESNVAARKLYQKLDFREIGRRKAYYRDPVEDAILLKLSF